VVIIPYFTNYKTKTKKSTVMLIINQK